MEWPHNYRDGYDVIIKEGTICEKTHISINAYYIEAVKTANKIAEEMGINPYRDEKYLLGAFMRAFYDEERHLFKDGVETEHISIVGNIFPFAFGLCPDRICIENITDMLKKRKTSSVSLFCTFLALMGLVRYKRDDIIKEMMEDEGAWLKMLSEDATTTFEGWAKNSKWNTSLFHMTFSYGALFLADANLYELFK